MAEQTEQGDLSAAELFREHGAFVARFLFRLGVPADAIQDTVQEVFLVVHQRGGYRRGPAKPTSYLALIASNAAAVQRRKARARTARVDGTEPDELTARGADPAHTLETHDALQRLQAALDKLDPDLRATLLLADGEDETCASIAEGMGVPVGTVYWRLHQARKKFQRALAAVDASWKGPRAAHVSARDRAGTPAPVFARSARMLTIFLGWGLPSWRGSEAHALLRETAQQMPVEFDVQAELLRHTAAAARIPLTTPVGVSLTPQASSGAFGSAGSALKTGLLVTTGGAALVTAIQLLPSQHAVVSPAVATARSIGVQAGAPIVVPQTQAVHPPAATELVPPAARAHGAKTDEPAPARNAHTLPRDVTVPEQAHAANTQTISRASSNGKQTVATPHRTLTSTLSASEQTAQPLARARERGPVAGAPREPSLQLPHAASTDAVVEAQALGRADSLLQTDPAQSLAIVRKVALHGQTDYLVEERRYIEVMALYALSYGADAKRAADAFLTAYPHSVFRERVKRAREGTYEVR